ncbi:hypothetical protein B4O97_12235 [Marispirochaeta aestuarii]|uniref:Phosphate regulon transcriptional regulatory protein PhoB n=1 Tax=Marispirochaeta aestuarii TaxID=1963862 RepID=A0A1Y1RWT1_9SPIO|nr:response regulator transcription factor [Marispirochaeta aestuarii]ORC34705.1 hypothetical protein B4O97_12235 [Marispirochaeta aestuarii]
MKTEKRVLVVDDESAIRKSLRAYLENEGYEVEEVSHGNEVLPAMRRFTPSVIILDVMLPGIDGIEVLRRIRQESSVMVLMLSARGDETDRLLGLRMGADDYVVKPFSPREVAARVTVLQRRERHSTSEGDRSIRFSRITIDPAGRKVWKDDRLLQLTPIEFDLLHVLATNHDRVLSRDQLIEHVWKDDYYIDERVVDVHIRRLRQKIEDNPASAGIVVTVRSAGYRFEAANA